MLFTNGVRVQERLEVYEFRHKIMIQCKTSSCLTATSISPYLRSFISQDFSPTLPYFSTKPTNRQGNSLAFCFGAVTCDCDRDIFLLEYVGGMRYIVADQRIQFPINLPYFQVLYNFSEGRDYGKSLRDYERGGFLLSVCLSTVVNIVKICQNSIEKHE